MAKRIMEVAETINVALAGWTMQEALTYATTTAGELGYAVPMGAGTSSPDTEVSDLHAAVILDLAVHTDADGVYTGDMTAVHAAAAEADGSL